MLSMVEFGRLVPNKAIDDNKDRMVAMGVVVVLENDVLAVMNGNKANGVQVEVVVVDVDKDTHNGHLMHSKLVQLVMVVVVVVPVLVDQQIDNVELRLHLMYTFRLAAHMDHRSRTKAEMDKFEWEIVVAIAVVVVVHSLMKI